MHRFLLLFVLIASSAHGQKQVLYYSNKWEITPKELAAYFRVCNYNPTVLFFGGEVKDYTLDSTLVMTGFYTSYGTKQGEFFFYYPSGKLQAQGSFKKNLRDGIWKYYYEDGRLQLEAMFTDGKFSPITANDPAGKTTIENGTGLWIYEYEWYNQKEKYIVRGEFVNGKKEGTWTCHLSSGELLYREVFKEDELKRGVVFIPFRRDIVQPFEKFLLPYKFEVTENFIPTIQTERRHYPLLNFLPGTIPDSALDLPQESPGDSVDTEPIYVKVDEPAQFPGGMDAMMKFLAANVRYPVEAKMKGIHGKVFVKFIVGEDGEITGIEILKGLDLSLNRESVRLVSMFPKWTPAKLKGEPVKSQFVLPVYFRLDR